MTSRNTLKTQGIWLGREHEFAAVEAGLEELREGRGSFFLVTGEPGIGKTRLADEVGRSAAARGLDVHWGRAWEAGGAPSYWPFITVLRSIGRRIDADDLDLTGLAEPEREELVAIVPELRERLGVVVPQSTLKTRDRFRLFDAVSRLIDITAAKAPYVLVFDDLHAADPSSLLMLHFLVRGLPSRAVLVIGTYREAEARLAPDVRGVLAQLAREACMLPLRRLERDEVAVFVAQSTGAAPTQERVLALHQLTEGNPLFLRELLQLHGRSAATPEGIREVVRARLSLLAPEVRAALEPAAVLGREFDSLTLAAVAGLGANEVAALLHPAVDAAIVEPLAEQPPLALPAPVARWRFTHVLLREGLYDQLPLDRRRALHELAARSLARGPHGVSLSETAHHLIHAVPAVTVGEAADAATRAAARAMDVLAFEDASVLLLRASTLLEDVDGEERRLFEVLVALGGARIRGNDVEAGKAACWRAAALARRLGTGELFARAVLAAAYEYTPGVRNSELVLRLEEALSLLPEGDGALRARCMAQLAAERQPEPDMEKPVELARAAVAMARRVGDKDTLRFTLTAAGLAMMISAEPTERIAINRETLLLALSAGDKRVALRAHLLLLTDYWELGDTKGAEAHVRAYEALAEELRHASFRWIGLLARAQTALWQGRFDEAAHCYRESESIVQKDPTRGPSMVALPIGFACAAERYEDLSSIESQVRAVLGSLPHELGGCLGEMLIAQLHGRAGDRTRAAAQLASVRAHPVFEQIKEPAWLALLVDACHLLGDKPLAELLYPSLLPRAQRFFNLAYLGPCCEPPYSRQLGLLAETLGNHDRAVEHLLDAQTRTALAGMSAFLARIRYELAGVLLARCRGDDRVRALELLDDARALAEERSQTGLLALIAERRCRVEVREPEVARTRAAKPDLAFTMQRHGDYWSIDQGAATLRLRDSRGLHLLAQLVATPGQEFHVLQLVGAGSEIAAGSDTGPLLDGEAIHAYRRRLLELREELEQSEQLADEGRVERARSEIERLTQELARAVGLGGRERRGGAAAERARTAVQKRLRDAVRRIERGLPELGRHLDQAIRTGIFCGYLPERRAGVRRR
ncbi:MAG TPA: AAA family ATPase [Polyangiales bacterium]|nr:AAA family ATPase [Polyangiales bacterium]